MRRHIPLCCGGTELFAKENRLKAGSNEEIFPYLSIALKEEDKWKNFKSFTYYDLLKNKEIKNRLHSLEDQNKRIIPLLEFQTAG